MPTPHPHAAVIKAWADDPSQVVQSRVNEGREWRDIDASIGDSPLWRLNQQYRIKPQPQAVGFTNVYANGTTGSRQDSLDYAKFNAIDHRKRIGVLEVRDDGTWTMHPPV